jgi:hypothetical protein
LCAISKGGGKRGKPAFGFPRFPRTGFFHSPAAAAFLFLKKHGSSLSSCGLQARVKPQNIGGGVAPLRIKHVFKRKMFARLLGTQVDLELGWVASQVI